jgi:hypothetical protein
MKLATTGLSLVRQDPNSACVVWLMNSIRGEYVVNVAYKNCGDLMSKRRKSHIFCIARPSISRGAETPLDYQVEY